MVMAKFLPMLGHTHATMAITIGIGSKVILVYPSHALLFLGRIAIKVKMIKLIVDHDSTRD